MKTPTIFILLIFLSLVSIETYADTGTPCMRDSDCAPGMFCKIISKTPGTCAPISSTCTNECSYLSEKGCSLDSSWSCTRDMNTGCYQKTTTPCSPGQACYLGNCFDTSTSCTSNLQCAAIPGIFCDPSTKKCVSPNPCDPSKFCCPPNAIGCCNPLAHSTCPSETSCNPENFHCDPAPPAPCTSGCCGLNEANCCDPSDPLSSKCPIETTCNAETKSCEPAPRPSSCSGSACCILGNPGCCDPLSYINSKCPYTSVCDIRTLACESIKPPAPCNDPGTGSCCYPGLVNCCDPAQSTCPSGTLCDSTSKACIPAPPPPCTSGTGCCAVGDPGCCDILDSSSKCKQGTLCDPLTSACKQAPPPPCTPGTTCEQQAQGPCTLGNPGCCTVGDTSCTCDPTKTTCSLGGICNPTTNNCEQQLLPPCDPTTPTSCPEGFTCTTGRTCDLNLPPPQPAQIYVIPDPELKDLPRCEIEPDIDGDTIPCDLCPDVFGDSDHDGCPQLLDQPDPMISPALDNPDLDPKSCFSFGGTTCSEQQTCKNGRQLELQGVGDSLSLPLDQTCCVPTSTSTPSACEEKTSIATLGKSFTITRGQCQDEDHNGRGTRTITLDQALPSDLDSLGGISSIIPECATTTCTLSSPSGPLPTYELPCTTLTPEIVKKVIVPTYTLNTLFLSLFTILNFYFFKKRK